MSAKPNQNAQGNGSSDVKDHVPSGLISEFFHDGIARLVPGAVVMLLYGTAVIQWLQIEFPKNTTLDIHVLAVPALIGAAWVIGLFLDSFFFALPAGTIKLACPLIDKSTHWLKQRHKVLQWLGKGLEWLGKLPKWLDRKLLADHWTQPSSSLPSQRRLHIKLLAEKTLFRSGVVICIFDATFLHRMPTTLSIGLLGACLTCWLWNEHTASNSIFPKPRPAEQMR